jgi:hypothetical protein
MYARAQNTATSPQKNQDGKTDKAESTPQKPLQAEQNSPKNEPSIAPVTEKKAKYRAARRPKYPPFTSDPAPASPSESKDGSPITNSSPDKTENPEKAATDHQKRTDAPPIESFDFQKAEPNPPWHSPTWQVPCEKNAKKGFLSSVFDTLDTDQLLLIALTVLLIMQGSDDILVLALCYILL